jgi:Icc-related predicted phosphoesterase
LERFLLLADVHGNIKALKKVLKNEPLVDYVIIAGDLPLTTPFSLIFAFAFLSRGLNRERYSYWVYKQNRERFVKFQERSVKKAFKLLEKHEKETIYVSGNVDCREIEKMFTEQERLHVIDNRCVKIGDYWWAGIPGSLVHIQHGICDREMTESTMAQQCKTVASLAAGKKNLILITHEPPFFANQQVTIFKQKKQFYPYQFKETGGSKHISEVISQLSPVFVVNGHYHEYPGKRQVKDTLVINPGCLANYNYALLLKENNRIKTTFKEISHHGFDFIDWIYSQRTE